MPRITRDTAARMATLARLALDDAELERAARELDSMLEHFDVIARVDTGGTEASTGAASASPLRSDEPRPSLSPAETFANAPDVEDGFFRVPRVMGS